MSTQFNRQELQSCLSKCIVVCGLRDILTKTGIASDEQVILSIEFGNDILISHEIPKKSPKIAIARQVTDFSEEINDFLNQAEAFAGFLSILPKSEKNLQDDCIHTLFRLIFDIGTFQSVELTSVLSRLQLSCLTSVCCPINKPCRINP